jgi:hypothetical protein
LGDEPIGFRGIFSDRCRIVDESTGHVRPQGLVDVGAMPM